MSACRFLLFGAPKFSKSAGEPLEIRSRKGVGLLAFVALAKGKPVSRDELCALLWADRQTTQARASLRQLLFDLRQDFGSDSDILDTETDGAICLKDKAIALDLSEFHQLRRAEDRQSLERALALRRGQFVEGLAPTDSAFAEWVEENRRSLDNHWCETAVKLLRMLEREADHRQSLEVAGQLLIVDPLCEAAHQAIVRAHLATNNRSLALRHYQDYRAKLDRDLGVEPDPLMEKILAEAAASPPTPGPRNETPDPTPAARRPKATIAVLPFEQSGSNPDDRHFSEGLTDDLTTELSRFADLAVISQLSVREHAKSEATKQRALTTDYLVRGNVRRAEARIRVTANLIHAADGTLIWSERFDREQGDLFALQDSIVQRIVAVLAARIEAFELAKTLQKPAVNYQAYDLFLKARFLLQKGGKDAIVASRPLLREAVARDPGFASAYAELSFGYLAEFESDWSLDPEAAGREALALAQQAVALDQANSNAQRALAAAQIYCNRNFDAGKVHADLALAQNPNDQACLCFLGFAMACNGRIAEGQSYSAESFRLNPLVPESCIFALALGAFLDGKYGDAINGFSRVSATYEEGLACLAAALWNLGEKDSARATMQRFMTLKREKMTRYPGNETEQWRAYILRLIPGKDSAAMEKLFDGMRSAGLPI